MPIGLQIAASSMPSSGSETPVEDTNSVNSALYISSGKVGVNNSSPGSSLEVFDSTNSIGALRVKSTTDITNHYGQLALTDDSSVGAGRGGLLNFRGKYDTSAETEFAIIRGYKANATSGNYDGELAFYVRSHGASCYTTGPRLLIESDGTVKANATSGGNIKLVRTNPSATYSGELLGQVLFDEHHYESTVDASVMICGYASENHASSDKGGDLVIKTKNNNTGPGSAATEKFRITNDGKVGIGTAIPGSKLEIALSTENLGIVDAGSSGATEQDWIEVKVGGISGYIRVHSSK